MSIGKLPNKPEMQGPRRESRVLPEAKLSLTGVSLSYPQMRRLIKVRYLLEFVLAGFCGAETNGAQGVKPRLMSACDS